MCFCFFRRNNKDKSESNYRGEEAISKEALRMLDEWQVQMYSNNSYLHKIPADRLDKKYQEFLTQLRYQYNKK